MHRLRQNPSPTEPSSSLSCKTLRPTMCIISSTILSPFSSLPVTASGKAWEEKLTGLRGVFRFTDFRCLYQRTEKLFSSVHLNDEMYAAYPKGFTREDIQYTTISNDKGNAVELHIGNYRLQQRGNVDGQQSCRQCHFRHPTELLKKEIKCFLSATGTRLRLRFRLSDCNCCRNSCHPAR